jgi:hypothetical protein
MRKRIVGLTVALVATLFAAPAAAQDGEGTVSVVHGVPGVTVDVWVDGTPLLEGFEPGTITDRLPLAAATYEIEVYAAGADPETEDALFGDDVELPAGVDASVVAHLTEDDQPTLTTFVDDLSEVDEGQARLTVRHTAAAPAVDVRADEQPVFTGLANPGEESAQIPAGVVSADVVLSGETDPVLGPVDLDLAAMTATTVYAVGSAEDDTLDLLARVDGGEPAGCPVAPAPESDFSDRAVIPAAHVANVDCATAREIVTGFADGTYRPTDVVRRDQMASFVARTLDAADGAQPLPAADDADAAFADIDGNVHGDNIRRLQAAGIVEGRSAEEYAPDVEVRRDQVATFALRAAAYASGVDVEELESGDQAFDDVDATNVHFARVNGASDVGLVEGRGDGTYTPAASTRRDQMASLMIRTLSTVE